MQDENASAGLPAPDEPGPVERVNPQGPAPCLLICDHASNFVPRALADLGLDGAALGRHIAWDIGAAAVTRSLARRLDAPAVLSHFSRLVVDPNRAPDDPTSIPAESDGVLVPGNQALDEAQRALRRAAFFRPYHAAIAEALREGSRGGRQPAIVSIHSFTPVMQGFVRPWQVGILWNRDGRLALPLLEGLAAAGFAVGDNEPYSGRDNHGYTLHHHAEPPGLPHVLIELRQDLIDTQQGAEDWAAVLEGLLRERLADPELTRAGS